MASIRTAAAATLVALVLVLQAPDAAVADEPSDRERAEQLAHDAMERLLRAIELFLQSIPQYEMPEVNEHGDIIIRRKRRPEPTEEEAPETDSTRT